MGMGMGMGMGRDERETGSGRGRPALFSPAWPGTRGDATEAPPTRGPPTRDRSRAPGPGPGKACLPHIPRGTPPCRSPGPDEVSVPPTPPEPTRAGLRAGGHPLPGLPRQQGPAQPRLRIHRDSENISSKEAPPTTGNPSAPVPGLTALGPGRSSPQEQSSKGRRRGPDHLAAGGPGAGHSLPFPRGGKAQAVSDRLGSVSAAGGAQADAGRPGQATRLPPAHEIPGARRQSPPHQPASPICAESRTRPRLSATGTVTAGVASLPEVCLGPRRRAPSLAEVADAREKRDDLRAAARWRPTTVANVPGTDPDRRRPPKRPSSSRTEAPGGPVASASEPAHPRHGTARHGTARHEATRRDAARRDPGTRSGRGGRREPGFGKTRPAGRLPRRGRAPHAIPRAGEITRTRRRGRGRRRGWPRATRTRSRVPGWEVGKGRRGRGREGGGWQTETRRALREQRRNRLWSPSSRMREVFRKQTGKAQKLEKKG